MNEVPCKDCLILPICKTETSLLRLVIKCELLRDYYNYTKDTELRKAWRDMKQDLFQQVKDFHDA